MKKQAGAEEIVNKIRDNAVLRSIGEGLIVIIDVDKGGKIAYVNKTFEDLTGWKEREVLNRSVVDILPREDKEGNIVSFGDRIVTQVLSGKKVVSDLTSPFFYLRKNKSKFPVASVITPIIVDKKIVGAVETFRDISKECESDKAKTEFASLVSHQLRTPFATINWYVELLLTQEIGTLNTKQIKYLQEVYKASKRMVALVNVLLSVSRIEMGKSDIEEIPTDIIALADTIFEEEKLEIKKKHLEIKRMYDAHVPRILADPKQVMIVLQNLINNAVKYTPNKGTLTLTIKIDTDVMNISMTDTGIGIPKKARSKIFTRFFRADNAKEQEPEGIGLGLYIMKAVIDLMGGTIKFTSKEGSGTTFYIAFPVKKV